MSSEMRCCFVTGFRQDIRPEEIVCSKVLRLGMAPNLQPEIDHVAHGLRSDLLEDHGLDALPYPRRLLRLALFFVFFPETLPPPPLPPC